MIKKSSSLKFFLTTGALLCVLATYHIFLDDPVKAAAQTSQEQATPAETVKSLYAAFGRGDMAAIEALIAPDAEWIYYGPDSLPFAGVRHGPHGAGDFFAKVSETLDNPIPEQRDFIVAGDTVIVPGTEESTVRSTGIRYLADNVHIFKVRNGKIVKFQEFIDSGKVLLAFQGDKSVAKIGSIVPENFPGSSPNSSGENPVDVVKSLYDAFDRGDMATIESLVAPNAPWIYYGPEEQLPFAGVHYGPEGVADFFKEVAATLENPISSQYDFLVSGNTVIVPGTEESTVKSTGIRYLVENVHIFKVRNGKIISFEEFIDSGKVLLAFQGNATVSIEKKTEVVAPIWVGDPKLELEAGKAVYTTCHGCHGNDGQGSKYMKAPNLTGMRSEYLKRQLLNFISGKRGKGDDAHGYQMVGRATAIGDKYKLDAVLAYIATLPIAEAVPVKRRPIPEKFKFNIEVCASCHGEFGEGNPDFNAPPIYLLDADYIERQLRNFQNDIRGYHQDDIYGKIMNASAKTIENEETLKALSKYFGKK